MGFTRSCGPLDSLMSWRKKERDGKEEGDRRKIRGSRREKEGVERGMEERRGEKDLFNKIFVFIQITEDSR